MRFGTLESSLLDAVGVPRPANQQDMEGFAFAAWNASAMSTHLRSSSTSTRGSQDEQAALEANPLWSRLDAVTGGRVFFVEAGVWNGLDPIAAGLVLDDIERHLGPLA